MQYAVPKCWYVFTSPYGVIRHNMRVFASTKLRASNPINTTPILWRRWGPNFIRNPIVLEMESRYVHYVQMRRPFKGWVEEKNPFPCQESNCGYRVRVRRFNYWLKVISILCIDVSYIYIYIYIYNFFGLKKRQTCRGADVLRCHTWHHRDNNHEF